MSNTAKHHDAVSMLIADHKKVDAMFKKYEALGDRAYVAKKALAHEICLALTEHTTIEEDLFYPAVRKALASQADLLDEAEVEHASAKELIAQIMSMEPDEDLYDAKVKVLSEQIKHHVKEEEEEMFPKVRKSRLDLDALGAEMAAEREQLHITA
jgi:hemerythrin superfamily protein